MVVLTAMSVILSACSPAEARTLTKKQAEKLEEKLTLKLKKVGEIKRDGIKIYINKRIESKVTKLDHLKQSEAINCLKGYKVTQNNSQYLAAYIVENYRLNKLSVLKNKTDVCNYNNLLEVNKNIESMSGNEKIANPETVKGLKHDLVMLEGYFRTVGTKGLSDKQLNPYFKEEKAMISNNVKLLENPLLEKDVKNFEKVIKGLKIEKQEFEIRRKARKIGGNNYTNQHLELASQTPTAPNGKALSISISRKTSTMYIFNKGVLVQSTPVNLGKESTPTAKGTFEIFGSTEKGIGVLENRIIDGFKRYPADDSAIQNKYGFDPYIGSRYFFRFTKTGIGIHDSNLSKGKNSYGDKNYGWSKSYGVADISHGCVNTPYYFLREYLVDEIAKNFKSGITVKVY